MSRGYGEGAIFQHRGRWCGQVSLGFDKDNKRIRRSVYGKTKREVQDKLLKLQQEAANGLLVDVSRDTVSIFIKRWLEDHVRLDREPNTYAQYESIFRLHVEPFLGAVLLQKLTPIQIQSLLAHLEQGGKSERIRQLAYHVLHCSLHQAVDWGVLPLNPVDRVKRPKHRRKLIEIVKEEDIGRFLDAAKADRLYPLYLLAITTGMRLGEVFGLKWTDVDLDKRTISVVRQAQEVRGELIIKDTKTAQGRRSIELPQALVDELEVLKAKASDDPGWVFTAIGGGVLRRSNFYRDSFRPLLKRAKMPGMTFHGLRHSHATLLLQAGVQPKVVAERLGHDVMMTLRIYSHVLPSLQREAAGKVDEMLDHMRASAAKKAEEALQAPVC